MKVIIDRIHIDSDEIYAEGEGVVDIIQYRAEVDYTIMTNNNKMRGEIQIPFEKYKTMTHQDLETYVEVQFNKQFAKRP